MDGAVPRVHRYGPGPDQFLELTLPDGAGPLPVAVVVHGGFWRAAFGVELARPLAADLAEHFLCDVQIFRLTGWSVENNRVMACNECRVCLKRCNGKTHHAKCRPAARRMGIKV